jgi:hypothetical protein
MKPRFNSRIIRRHVWLPEALRALQKIEHMYCRPGQWPVVAQGVGYLKSVVFGLSSSKPMC